MRWPLAGVTVSFLGLACSAPEESAIFEDAATVGAGGVSSADATTSTTTGSNEGGAGAEASDTAGGTSTGDGSVGDTATTSAGGSTSTSVGGSGSGTTQGGAGGTGGTGGTASSSSSSSSGGVAGSGGGGCVETEEVCDGADNDCDGDVDDDACPSNCVGARFEEHTYLFCDRPGVVGNNEAERSWQQAMQFCENRAGFRLTLVETEEENAFIYQTLVRLDVSGDVWMGATDQEDEGWWTWAASEDPDDWVAFYDEEAHEPIANAFNDWREGEPNDDGYEDCGVFEDLGSDEWAWDDRNCQNEYDLFVCESSD